MPSPQFEMIRRFIEANPTPPDLTVTQRREAMHLMAAQTPLPEDVYVEEITADTVPGLLVAAAESHDQHVILYLHGGAYCVGSARTHQDLGWRLSAAAQARVLLLDYRLAPEHPFPAAVEDATAAYGWLLANGIEPAHMAIAGDSAGGGLALAALMALRDAEEPLPAAAVCFSPWTDLAGTGESMTTCAGLDPVLQPALLREFAQFYLADADARTPLASPLYGELTGLPPLLLQVGTDEILLDDATRLAEKAEAAGVAVTLEVWQEMIHVWQAFAAIVPEGQEAITQAGQFIHQHLHA